MKKTKLLTSLAALALVLSLGACGDVTINVGDVDVDLGGDSSESTAEEDTSTDESEETCRHEWGEWETKLEPTCTEDGYQERECGLCGETQKLTIPATGHTWGESVTPNNNGTHTLTCTVCQATETEDCEFGDWEDTGEGTTHARTCSICGYSTTGTEDNPSDTGAHRYRSGEYVSDSTGHWQECTMCGYKKDVTAHTYVTATNDAEHYSVCSVCGYIDEQTRAAHTYNSSYSYDERGHYQECTECGYISEIVPHTTSGSAATDTGNGHQHTLGACTVCGYGVTEFHQVISNTNPTCSVCGATNLNIEGLEYTVSGNEATVSYTGSSAVGDTLFVPATYVDGGNEYPVTATATATTGSTSNKSFGGATAYYTYIGLPEGLKTIGNYSFAAGQYTTTALKEISLPSTLTSIGNYAFRYSEVLETVLIAEGTEGSQLTTIGDYGFSDCALLEYIDIPESVTAFNQYAFRNDKALTSVTLNPGMTVGGNVFYSCTGITSVSIPAGVNFSGYTAFYGCTGITYLVIEEGVTSLGYQTFVGCNNLTEIYYTGDSAAWETLASDINYNDSLINSSYQKLTYTVYVVGEWQYVDGIPTPLA